MTAPYALTVVYEDGELICVVKPSGVISQSADGVSMISLLSERTGAEVLPVHRLDRETSGLIVYAKTKRAAAALSESFANGQARKCYLAITVGVPEVQSGEYRDLLYHDNKRNKSFVVSRDRRGVREAVLRYSVAEEKDGLALVAVRLLTGRTHQVRVQFSSRGTPLYGDRRYGGTGNRMALACAALSFPHPVSRENLKFTVSPTGDPWDAFDIDAAVRSLDDLP